MPYAGIPVNVLACERASEREGGTEETRDRGKKGRKKVKERDRETGGRGGDKRKSGRRRGGRMGGERRQ